MNDKPFNWGIIGPGDIAHQFARDMQVTENGRCYAVVSRSLDRAKGFAKQYHLPKAYDSVEALLNDPAVEAVYIATPHPQHFENTLLCLNGGKPVLCEKPFTANADHARQLMETATAKNLFLMEALWSRFLPGYQQVREWLHNQAIGDLKFISATFGFKGNLDPNERLLNPHLAGGTLLDIGVYPIAISQWITRQNPQSFAVQANLGQTGVDEQIGVTLRYPNGTLAQFICSFLVDGDNEMVIYGTKGHIRLPSKFWEAQKATLATDEQELTVKRPFRSHGFEYQIEEAMRCIRGGLRESPIMPHADTLANMQLMDQIRDQIGLRYPFEE